MALLGASATTWSRPRTLRPRGASGHKTHGVVRAPGVTPGPPAATHDAPILRDGGDEGNVLSWHLGSCLWVSARTPPTHPGPEGQASERGQRPSTVACGQDSGPSLGTELPKDSEEEPLLQKGTGVHPSREGMHRFAEINCTWCVSAGTLGVASSHSCVSMESQGSVPRSH